MIVFLVSVCALELNQVFVGSITPSIECLWLLPGPPELQVYLLQLLQADGILNQLRKVTPTSIMFEQSTLYPCCFPPNLR